MDRSYTDPPGAEEHLERPEIRDILEHFAGFCRYVHFDKRGTGSSDRTGLVPGIDALVEDLRAVIDAAGMERAHLFGVV